jgi:hypothetical protein
MTKGQNTDMGLQYNWQNLLRNTVSNTTGINVSTKTYMGLQLLLKLTWNNDAYSMLASALQKPD